MAECLECGANLREKESIYICDNCEKVYSYDDIDLIKRIERALKGCFTE